MDIDHQARVRNADGTRTLLAALRMLEATDFAAMFGSGVMVRLTPITEGRRLADEFVVAAEDLAAVAPLLARSLRASLGRRRELLLREAREVGEALGGRPVAAGDD